MRDVLDLLIIDDSPDDAELLVMDLERGGFQVQWNRVDSEDDLRKALSEKRWSIVLCDYRMPNLTPEQALKTTRALGGDVPLIVVSGTIRDQDAVSLFKEGAKDFLPKDNLIRLPVIIHRELLEFESREKRRLAERALHKSNAELAQLNRRLKEVVKSTEVLSVFSQVKDFGIRLLEEFSRHMMAEGGSLYLREENGFRLSHSLDPGHAPDYISLPLREGSVLNKALVEQTPVLIKKVEEFPGVGTSGWPGYMNSSILVFPLQDMDGVVNGLLSLHSKSGPAFVEQDKEIGLVLASYGCEVLRTLQTKEKVLENQERYHSLTQSAKDAIITTNKEGRITSWNNGAQAVFQYNEEEILDCPVTLIMPERFHKKHLCNFEKAVATGKGPMIGQTIELVGRRKDGTEFPLEISISTWVQRNSRFFSAILRDITDRKQAEAAINSREDILEVVRFAAQSFLKSSSWETSLPELMKRLGMAVKVSRVYLFKNHSLNGEGLITNQIAEWCAADITSQIDSELVHNFSYQLGSMERWQREMEKGGEIVGHVRDFPISEQKILSAQNILSIVVVPIMVENLWWGFIGFDECVSERVWSEVERDALRAASGTIGAAIAREQNETSLFETKNLLERIFSNLHTSIVYLDSQFNFIRVNERYAKDCGHPVEFFTGKNHFDLYPHKENQAIFQRVVDTGEPFSILAKPFEFPDHPEWGVTYWDWTLTPLKKKDGTVETLVFHLMDVTDQKQIEIALRMSKEQAVAANQAKSEFLAVMSHEIRTPLNAVLGMADVLMETNLDVEQSRYMEVLNRAGENMLYLIEDILDLTQIEYGLISLEKQSVDLPGLVRTAIEIQAQNAERKGLILNYRINPEVPDLINSDPKQIRQILLNLLGNAVKFTDQGNVDLAVSQPDHQTLLFSISDTGIGIPKEKQELIFEPFSLADASTTRRHGGAGLGLSLCKRLADAMGGRIWVESELGIGSTFHFSIPLTFEEQKTEQPLSILNKVEKNPLEQKIQQTSKTCSILLVEDVEENAMVIEAYLNNTPHQMDITEDGAQAVEKVKSGKRYDLVLMDIQMEGMDGLEATRQIRKWEEEQSRSRNLIVALSAHAMKGDKEKSLAAGCDDHITKPISKKKLLEVIEGFAK
ncbi:MAG: response regulator [Magnetococcales bacterium]|nr:response regulator [Magnetococcales bacterium]